jgi:uncharacterized protein (TIGR04168 family)
MVSGQNNNGKKAVESTIAPDNQPELLKIAVIGDVHNAWDADDELALRYLGVDLVLLVGDFGNEAVDVVQQIAELQLPKAAIFGNHDAWYTATAWGQKKCPYDRTKEDWVQQQIDLLGECHVGYGKLDFPELGLTVVGSRPFSWGGAEWKNEEFYRNRYAVHSFQESTDLMAEAIREAAHNTLIFVGHCGPAGLGDRADDPCGRDWQPLGGDFGDPDFTAAIAQARQMEKQIPLVAFGHMHHQLRHTRDHQRKAVIASPEGTVYVNAASVPRIIKNSEGIRRNFSLVTLEQGTVSQVSLIWVDQDFDVLSESIFFDAAKQMAVPGKHPEVA